MVAYYRYILWLRVETGTLLSKVYDMYEIILTKICDRVNHTVATKQVKTNNNRGV